jgi:hypothetical protein
VADPSRGTVHVEGSDVITNKPETVSFAVSLTGPVQPFIVGVYSFPLDLCSSGMEVTVDSMNSISGELEPSKENELESEKYI